MNSTVRKGIVALLLLVSHSAFAAIQNSKFYVGGSVGAASLMDNENTTQPIRDVHTLGSAGGTAGVLLGYDFFQRNRFGVGVEAFANVVSLNLADNQNYAPIASYTASMRYNLGVRLLPRYEVMPRTDAHVILGYANASFKINDNGNYGIVNSAFSKSGFQTGLGLETLLPNCLLLRGDVLYTFYQPQTTNGITTSSPSTTQPYQNRFSTLEAVLSLVYKDIL